MKKVLIITPYFPPSNTADTQRVRMSLPYYNKFEWEAEIVMVDPKYSDTNKDYLLVDSIPKNIIIHQVKAFSKKITAKFGLGSLALRSMYYYFNYVNQLLLNKKFDLILFSTTEFPIMILGAYWKKRFNIPYIIDMQDPWHTEYYQTKPKSERPPKYWFSYRLNKYLEPIAMKQVSGLMSVSQAYLDTLTDRYKPIQNIPQQVITFGAFPLDFDILKQKTFNSQFKINKELGIKNIVYIGRGGHDMKPGLSLLFEAFKNGLKSHKDLFERIKFYFIGTSYAADGHGKPTIKPIASIFEVDDYVEEHTNRIAFYDSLYNLNQADGLLIIGSEDPQYTASKIYPYMMIQKPLLALFHCDSSAYQIIEECTQGTVVKLNQPTHQAIQDIEEFLVAFIQDTLEAPQLNWNLFSKYTAENRTEMQCNLFNATLENFRLTKH
ncbi:MAG: hypothetical protein EOO99_07425 [Pedobacter sp.]|nr:MAG: hypothetical protein EOO99_07425 [Pedobacter sp.]